MKKKMLFALAVAILVAPASASATIWTHDHKALSGSVVEEFTGFVEFELNALPGSAFGCVWDAEIELTATNPASGHVKNLEITTEVCGGTGLLTGCKLELDFGAVGGGSLPIDVNTSDLTITNVDVTYVFDESCLLGGAQLTLPELTATPNNSTTIASLEIEGTGSIDPLALPIDMRGVLVANNPGTYGID